MHRKDIFISTVTIIGALIIMIYDSVETGTGNRNYHSRFSAHCVEMPFSMQNASRNVKKRDGSD